MQAQHDQVPPDSKLTFDIEILKVEDGPKPANVFKEIDSDHDNKLSRPEIGAYLNKQLNRGQYGDMGTVEDPEQQRMIEEIFTHEDTNRDDFISHEEFSGPKHDHEEL